MSTIKVYYDADRTKNDVLQKTYTINHKELIKILDKHYLKIKIENDIKNKSNRKNISKIS